ncbi:energy transducer TonB [Acidithiobacillus ferridurans]|uniref:energy transducer TonB family protein n=1 Tax=Acidithiobacillus ferridurans TaxID=1232575 RepID=UPI000DE360E6|nr:energy transducer TonB [Acidithiobacillus ferridurans]RBL99827.1 energy transducer TonB [Acidithiobacillus ferridurans]
MTTTMPRIANNALMPEPKERHFKYAVGGAVVVEALLVLGLIWYGHSTPPVKAVKPKEHVIAVQMVTLPQPSPKVVPKPLPKPVPPKPVVHHVPPPPPRPHPKVVIPPKPASTPPAPPVKQVTPPKPVPMPAPKPVVTPPPAPPPMSAQQTASMMGRYVGMVRPIIQQSLRVPAELRAMGLSGKATVEFEISPSGQLLWAKIIKPSPLGAVNRAALAAIQKGGFPPFLKKMPKQNTVFQIDVKVGAGSN